MIPAPSPTFNIHQTPTHSCLRCTFAGGFRWACCKLSMWWNRGLCRTVFSTESFSCVGASPLSFSLACSLSTASKARWVSAEKLYIICVIQKQDFSPGLGLVALVCTCCSSCYVTLTRLEIFDNKPLMSKLNEDLWENKGVFSSLSKCQNTTAVFGIQNDTLCQHRSTVWLLWSIKNKFRFGSLSGQEVCLSEKIPLIHAGCQTVNYFIPKVFRTLWHFLAKSFQLQTFGFTCGMRNLKNSRLRNVPLQEGNKKTSCRKKKKHLKITPKKDVPSLQQH